MTKANDIPVGFQLHITSWENDADCYNTVIVSGLTREDCAFLIAVAKLFESGNRRKGGFGNKSPDADEVDAAIDLVRADHPGISAEYATMDFKSAIELVDGYGYESDYLRVYDSHQVFYIAAPVADVTKEFT